MIDQRQRQRGWGAAVIPRLASELRNELPEMKGFSERNIKRMLAFYGEYSDPSAMVRQTVAQLPATEEMPQPPARTETVRKVPQPAAQIETTKKVPQPAAQLKDAHLWSIPWFHHIVLMEKVKDRAARFWYMRETRYGP